jgi:DNA anti-recombination protein RmuC
VPAVKLSRQFYEHFGDKLVNELVELLNQMDSVVRNELREQNELNFARFDAKLEQRLAAFDAKLDQRIAALEVKFEQRMAELSEQISKRLEDRFEKRFVLLDARLDRLEQRLDQQNRLFILAWVTQIATIIGLGLR